MYRCRRRFKRLSIQEQLEPRLLLTAFVQTQLGRDINVDPSTFSSLEEKTILGKDGTAYFATTSDSKDYHIRYIPGNKLADIARECGRQPDVDRCGVQETWPSVGRFEGLLDYGVNAVDEWAAVHQELRLDSTEEVISRGDDSEIEHLIVDATRPRGGLGSNPVPNLGDTAVRFYVVFSDDHFLRPESLGLNAVRFEGPNQPKLTLESKRWDGRQVHVEFLATPEDGIWDHNDNGEYEVVIQGGTVADLAGNTINDTLLKSFELKWESDPNELVEKNEISASGDPSNVPSGVELRYFTEGKIDYISLQSLKTPGYLGIKDVRIADNGDAVFSATHFPADGRPQQKMLGLWGEAGAVKLRLVTDTLGQFFSLSSTEVDVGTDGQLVVHHSNRILLYGKGLSGPDEVISGCAPPLADESGILSCLVSQVSVSRPRLSSDGSMVFFQASMPSTESSRLGANPEALPAQNTFAFGIWGVDVATGQRLERIVGHAGDAFLDTGEHWNKVSDRLADISSESFQQLDLPILVGAVQDAEGNHWVAYLQRSRYQPDEGKLKRSERLYMRKLSFFETDNDGKPDESSLGPPILLLTHNQSEIDAFLPPLQLTPADFGIDVSGKTFFGVHGYKDVFDFTDPKQRITNTFASGTVPEFTLPGSDRERHAMLERFAHEVAYLDIRDPESALQRGTIVDGGYVIGGLHLDEDDPTGFESVELFPLSHSASPVLAFRGTKSGKDFWSDANPLGVGFDQFDANRAWVARWVSDYADQYEEAAIFTGHSLGGALAQWFATSVMTDTDERLAELVTFNSPGISSRHVNLASAELSSRLGKDHVTHYVVRGDFVSLAGERFIEGEVQLVRVGNAVLLDDDGEWIPRHRRPILLQSLKRQLTQEQIAAQQSADIEQLQVEGIESIPIEVLNHPEFNYLNDSGYRFFLWGSFWWLSAVPTGVSSNQSQHLVARQRVESLRTGDTIGGSFLLDTMFQLAVDQLPGAVALPLKLLEWDQLIQQTTGQTSPVFVSVNFGGDVLPARAPSGAVEYDVATQHLTVDQGVPLYVATDRRPDKLFIHETESLQLFERGLPNQFGDFRTITTFLPDVGSGEFTIRTATGGRWTPSSPTPINFACAGAFDIPPQVKPTCGPPTSFAIATSQRVGDADGDGVIGFSDFLSLARNFGATDATWEMGDFNRDSRIDFADFLLLAAEFGK